MYNTSSNEISYNNFINILIQSNAWTTYALNLNGRIIHNQFISVQCIDFSSPKIVISTSVDVTESNYFSGCFGFSADVITDLGDGNLIINGGEIASAFHTKGNIVNTPKSTGNVIASTGITTPMLSRVMYYNGDSPIDITATTQISPGENGQTITIIGSSDTNTLKIDHNNGVWLGGGTSFTIGQGDVLELIYSTAVGVWLEISRSNN
jgi:hypothetical protein